jgi:hypothetical protein
MRILALSCALVLSACGATLFGGSPSPTASPSSTTAVPTGTLPGSAVRITVNGTQYTQNTELTLRPTGHAVVIVIVFPFTVDRPAVEQFLPKAPATIDWIDERTVRLTYPETESNMSFKAVQVPSVDRTAMVDIFSVHVAFPATKAIDLFTVAELNAIQSTGVRTAATAFRVATTGWLTVSPDGRRAIEFEWVAVPGQAAPAMIDLATRASSPLAQPTAADGPFAFADWLPDGRLMIIGRDLWIGSGDGSGMRKVADAASAVGGTPRAAVPNTTGDRVVISAANADGHAAVIDLRDGTVARITGPFRAIDAHSGVSFAWSSDGRLLAGLDSDGGGVGFAGVRARIVDVTIDKTVRTIEGGVIAVNAFPTGELVVTRESGEQGAGARALGLVMGFDGVEHRGYLGCAWSMSPDARFIVQAECGGAGFIGYTLIDVSTGKSFGFGVPAPFHRWLADDRAAFY